MAGAFRITQVWPCTHGTVSLPSESRIQRDRDVRLRPSDRVRRRRDTYHLPGKSQWPSSRRRPHSGYRPCFGAAVSRPDNATVGPRPSLTRGIPIQRFDRCAFSNEASGRPVRDTYHGGDWAAPIVQTSPTAADAFTQSDGIGWGATERRRHGRFRVGIVSKGRKAADGRTPNKEEFENTVQTTAAAPASSSVRVWLNMTR